MAKSKSENLHKKIENEEDDPFAAAARVSEETSSDGKFSTYEYTKKKDKRDGDLILQYRGKPSK